MSKQSTHSNPDYKELRQQLRLNLTPAEAYLWNYLKSRKFEGKRFTKQHSIGYYIVDFYCASEKLIIELDGPIHETRIQEDEKRQAILENMGFTILRFKNHELSNIDQVLKTISNHFSKEVSPLPFKERGLRG